MRNNVAAMLKALGTRLKKNNKNNNCSNSSAVEFQLILWIILNLEFTLATYIMAYKTTLRNDQLFFPYVVTVVMLKCGCSHRWQRSTHSPLVCRQRVASVTRQFSDIVFRHSFMNHLSFWYFVRASFELSVCVMISFSIFFLPSVVMKGRVNWPHQEPIKFDRLLATLLFECYSANLLRNVY